jgi:hypothetical protein
MKVRLLVVLLTSMVMSVACTKNKSHNDESAAPIQQAQQGGDQSGGQAGIGTSSGDQSGGAMAPSGSTVSDSDVTTFDVTITGHEDATDDEETALMADYADVARDVAYLRTIDGVKLTSADDLDMYAGDQLEIILARAAGGSTSDWSVMSSRSAFNPDAVTVATSADQDQEVINQINFTFHACITSENQDQDQDQKGDQGSKGQQPPGKTEESCIDVNVTLHLTPVVEQGKQDQNQDQKGDQGQDQKGDSGEQTKP